MAEKVGDEIYGKVHKEVSLIDSECGGNFHGNFWKLKKMLFPKSNEPTTAMKDGDGNIITNDSDIKKETIKNYKKLFENKTINPSFSHIVKDVKNFVR